MRQFVVVLGFLAFLGTVFCSGRFLLVARDFRAVSTRVFQTAAITTESAANVWASRYNIRVSVSPPLFESLPKSRTNRWIRKKRDGGSGQNRKQCHFTLKVACTPSFPSLPSPLWANERTKRTSYRSIDCVDKIKSLAGAGALSRRRRMKETCHAVINRGFLVPLVL